jgi:two-component system sensor histidine kinase/response regulator
MTDPSAPTLDVAVLAAVRGSVGGDDAFVLDLVETYLADGTEQIAAITAAVAAGDAAALVRPAHTLKSSSFTVGAMRLGELARSLEQDGRRGVLGDAAAEADATRAEWTLVDAALRAWLATS